MYDDKQLFARLVYSYPAKVSDENDEYTRDWYIAKELYELLKANSIRVFMSSFSIEEMGESLLHESNS